MLRMYTAESATTMLRMKYGTWMEILRFRFLLKTKNENIVARGQNATIILFASSG